mmetsp:Transcript_105897/g.242477  ORF Transcript_105897/g.242477 Transcript_105897/m.242477 type:complete len:210 (+) Transcript_105897:558-1187(+)
MSNSSRVTSLPSTLSLISSGAPRNEKERMPCSISTLLTPSSWGSPARFRPRCSRNRSLRTASNNEALVSVHTRQFTTNQRNCGQSCKNRGSPSSSPFLRISNSRKLVTCLHLFKAEDEGDPNRRTSSFGLLLVNSQTRSASRCGLLSGQDMVRRFKHCRCGISGALSRGTSESTSSSSPTGSSLMARSNSTASRIISVADLSGNIAAAT